MVLLAANHVAILADTVTFILRQSDDELEEEIFPRAGYVRILFNYHSQCLSLICDRGSQGFFIVFMYMFVLPAPTVYYFFKDSKSEDENEDETGFVSTLAENSMGFENPLLDGDDYFETPSNKKEQSGGSTVRLAKLQREGKEMRAIVKAKDGELTAMREAKDGELTAKDDEIAALRQENARLGGEVTAATHGATNAETMAAMTAAAKVQADATEAQAKAATEAQAKAEAETHMVIRNSFPSSAFRCVSTVPIARFSLPLFR